MARVTPGDVRSCRTKRKYLNRVEALLAAADRPVTLTTYRCVVCRNWHLTSNVKGL